MRMSRNPLAFAMSAMLAAAILSGCSGTAASDASLSPEEAALMPDVIGGKDDFRAGEEPAANPGEVVISNRSTEGFENISEIRGKAVSEAATAYGTRKGHQRRTWEINKMLEDRGPTLSQVFDFTRVVDLAPGGAGVIVPPIVSAGTRAFTVDAAGTEAAVADAYMTITKPGRISRTAPVWQEYLVSGAPTPQEPPKSVLPTDKDEVRLFQSKFNEGWEEGKKLADDELEARIAKLQRDYHGMLQYRKLVANGMMDRLVLTDADFGVTSKDGEMRIGSRVVKITSEADFQANPARWSVRSMSERDVLVSSGVNPTLGDMLK